MFFLLFRAGLFDSIVRNPTAAIDWAVLLAQLVTAGVIDLSNNTELFTTLQDMLATLLHATLIVDGQSDRGEDSRKYYPILIKKLKKELAERKNSPSIGCIKQLLPLPKLTNEFVTCEPYGTITDTKGNKSSGFDSNDKKQGHRLHEKQRVSPWEILEGHKTAAPLSWAWFGAVRIERKPMRYQEVQRLQRHHTHSMQKPASYFLEHPVLPPEELEPPVMIHENKIMPIHHQPKEEMSNMFKMEIPPTDQSPRGGSKRGQKTNQRRPRGRRGAAAAAAAAAANVIGQPQPVSAFLIFSSFIPLLQIIIAANGRLSESRNWNVSTSTSSPTSMEQLSAVRRSGFRAPARSRSDSCPFLPAPNWPRCDGPSFPGGETRCAIASSHHQHAEATTPWSPAASGEPIRAGPTPRSRTAWTTWTAGWWSSASWTWRSGWNGGRWRKRRRRSRCRSRPAAAVCRNVDGNF